MMLIIYGPTVTGKTSFATAIAKKINGVILSADSRQVYKDLDIGTGKVSFDSKIKKLRNYWIVDGIKIYGFDIKKPGESYSVAEFIIKTQRYINSLQKKNKTSILVGGTGYYVKSLINPPDTVGVPINNRLRIQLDKIAVKELYKKLLTINPERAVQMSASDQKNKRRLIRAIETTGARVIKQQKIVDDYMLIGLTASNNYLFKKADDWLKLRIKKGLLKETKELLNKNVDPEWLENLGLEYKWTKRIILNETTKKEGIARLQADIHNLIRRQKTFFGQFSDIQMINVEEPKWQSKLEKRILLWYTQKHNGKKPN